MGEATGLRREDVVVALRAAGCVFAEEEADLLVRAAARGGDLGALVARRAAGHPLEHVVGQVEFSGVTLAVGPGVFVPRPRTALLVEQTVHGLADALAVRRRPVVVELCCGCGAVAAAVAARVPRCEIHAVDLDPVAVRYARRNLRGTGARVHQGDLDEPLPDRLVGRADVVVANAPYVPTERIGLMPREARDHEPRHTLDGGADGLDVLRRVVVAAPRLLRPGGRLVVECAQNQAAGLIGAARAVGLTGGAVTDEELGATTVVATRRLPAPDAPEGRHRPVPALP